MGKTLTTLLRDHWEERANKLSEDYKRTFALLKSKSTKVEYKYITILIKGYETETLGEIDARTQKKIRQAKAVEKTKKGNNEATF